MYDDEYDDHRVIKKKAPFFTRLTRFLGVMSSLFLVGFLAFWAYNLGRREATDVPVIAEIEGLPRSEPENRGGAQVDFQGLEVNQVLEGQSASDSSEVTLAPRASNLDDIAPAEPVIQNEQVVLNDSEEGADVSENNDAEIVELTAVSEVERTSAPLARPPLLFIPRKDQMDPRTAEARPVGGFGAEELSDEEPPVPGAELAATTAENDVDNASAIAVEDGLGERLPTGTPLIQLAANPDLEVVRKQWQNIRSENADILGNKSLYIEDTVVGGTTYYRLRVQGYADEQETKAACDALIARNVDCLNVRAK